MARKNQAVLPRYLQVAHWLLEHRRWMTARHMAVVFDINLNRMCDDFASIRQRPDLFEIAERKRRCGNSYENELSVICINPYRLDGRQYPHVIRAVRPTLSNITWQDLISRPWCQFTTHENT